MDQQHIRNFSIIAHIDHGKSTLADRILELTHAVSQRRHARAGARLDGARAGAGDHDQGPGRAGRLAGPRAEPDRHARARRLHLRGLARRSQACEGALLVVDAAQGIEAQTLANAYLAIENELEIVPIVNKIDLPQADPDGVAMQLAELLGDDPANVLRISAKTGSGVEAVLDAVIDRIPAPAGELGRARRGR